MQSDEIKGCVHLHIKDGQIKNVFSHLSNFPDNCVIHLKPDDVLTEEAFVKSHPQDENEIKLKEDHKIFELGDKSIELK